jgi:replicative DNA helicase
MPDTTEPRPFLPFKKVSCREIEACIIADLIYCKADEHQPSLMTQIRHRLRPEYFFDEDHRIIFRHLLEMHYEGSEADFPTLHDRLDRAGDLPKVGGMAYLTELCSSFNALPSLIGQHIRELHSYWMHREMMRDSKKVAAIAESGDPMEATKLARAMTEKMAIANADTGGFVATSTVLTGLMETLERNHANKGKSPYPFTGLSKLDRLVGGFVPGDMMIVGAETGHGKSAFALHCLRAIAMQGHVGAIASLEMSSERLMQRMIASASGVPLGAMRMGTMSEDQMRRVAEAVRDFPHDSVLFIDEQNRTDVEKIVSTIAAMKTARPDLVLVAVDYLQLVDAGTLVNKGSNREQFVAAVSRSLKLAAVASHVTVLALSQLNEEGKLRDSRAIGFNADTVLTLELEGETDADSGMKKANLRVMKGRDTEVGGIVRLMFHGATQTFHEQAGQEEEDEDCPEE